MKYIRKKMLEDEENNMSKSLLLSINPQYVAKILNGEKKIEIRKRFPKEYRGWVYIYCTKDRKKKLQMLVTKSCMNGGYFDYETVNGKVVARFYCDHIETFYAIDKGLCKLSCLFPHKINNYLQGKEGYAIYITQLEIFDKPKELSEFYKVGKKCEYDVDEIKREWWCEWCNTIECIGKPLTKAPQSYMHIEVEE